MTRSEWKPNPLQGWEDVGLIQIDNYGPWTVTPEPRREVDLQTLQSRLYADLSQLFGDREGYADAIEHVRETVGVDLKVGVGRAGTAQAAGMAAKHALETCRKENTVVEFAD